MAGAAVSPIIIAGNDYVGIVVIMIIAVQQKDDNDAGSVLSLPA